MRQAAAYMIRDAAYMKHDPQGADAKPEAEAVPRAHDALKRVLSITV